MQKITRLFVRCAASAVLVGTMLSSARAQNWVQTSAPNQHWQSIASSADGRKLVAVTDNNGGNRGAIYTSTNSGNTWVSNTAPNATWNFVASSADGNRLAATTYGGGIYTSTNAGATWTKSSAPNQSWWAIASSSDGARLVAGPSMKTSTNAGLLWTSLPAPAEEWTSIACSTDGRNIVAGGRNTGKVYVSTNSGSNWRLVTNITTNPSGWVSVASSGNGNTLLAMGQYVYVSTNAGATWSLPNTSPQSSINTSTTAASSADGRYLAVGAGDIGIYISTNSGANWVATGTGPNTAGAFSANGGMLMASLYAGGIYILNLPPSPPSVSLIKAVKPAFSPLVVGFNYQLQVSTDLTSWTNQGSAFAATNTSMVYSQYFDVDNWGSLFFRTQVVP